MSNPPSYPKYADADPRDLRFTQDRIKDSFSKDHSGVKLRDTVEDIKNGKFDPSCLGPLNVHTGGDGRLWCENNRRLFVLREAGVESIRVRMKFDDFISRHFGEETKERLGDPNFVPTVLDPNFVPTVLDPGA